MFNFKLPPSKPFEAAFYKILWKENKMTEKPMSGIGLWAKYEREKKQHEAEKEKANLENRIKTLETEIQQIKQALGYLGVECKNGVFLVKEQPKKKFLGLF